MQEEFLENVKKLLDETFLSITSAKMNEDFLESASKAFREIPNFVDSFSKQEKNVNTPDPP